MTASARRSATSRRGSSAARSATSSSAARSSTSTSPAPIPSWPRASTRGWRAARSFRSRSATAPGASPSAAGTRSTSRRSTARRSRTTSPRGTSRSTRSRARSRAAGSSIRSSGEADLAAGRLRAVAPASLRRTIRCGSCAPSGSRTSSASGWTRRRRSSCAQSAARVGEPAGERILGELERLSPDGFRRADELGLLAPLGGVARRPRPGRPGGHARLRAGRRLRRAAPRPSRSPTSSARLARTLLAAERPRRRLAARRSTASAGGRSRGRSRRSPSSARPTSTTRCVRRRADDHPEPLLRGEDVLELGVEPGPEVGRLLELVAEERAVGTISTRDEALELVLARSYPASAT